MTLAERIKKHEGFCLTPYRDTEGLLTVGYGRCIDRVPFTKAEVEFMFLTDLDRAKRGAESFPQYARLDAVRAGVIVEMVFQMGAAGVAKFRRFWAAVDAQDWDKAAGELLDSKWAEQTPARAKELSEIFRNGQETD